MRGPPENAVEPGQSVPNPDLQLYAALLERTLEDGPEYVLETTESIGADLPSGGVIFARVLAQTLLHDDPRLLTRMQDAFSEGEGWRTRSDPRILIDELLNSGLSFRDVLPLLEKVDSTSHFAEYMVQGYFSDRADFKTID